jgi:hypothetical protein
MFAAISKQLATMDDRLQSMEGKLHNVDMIQSKVSAPEESTSELGVQQDMLASAVERIDIMQTQLATNAGCGATTPHDPPDSRP